jgi:hypothetical protein
LRRDLSWLVEWTTTTTTTTTHRPTPDATSKWNHGQSLQVSILIKYFCSPQVSANSSSSVYSRPASQGIPSSSVNSTRSSSSQGFNPALMNSGANSYSYQHQQMQNRQLETQNDDQLNLLTSKVGRLKEVE